MEIVQFFHKNLAKNLKKFVNETHFVYFWTYLNLFSQLKCCELDKKLIWLGLCEKKMILIMYFKKKKQFQKFQNHGVRTNDNKTRKCVIFIGKMIIH